jgi:hypothetical protein
MATLLGIIYNYQFEILLFIVFKNSFKNLMELNIKGNKNGGLTVILNRYTT